MYSGAEHSSEDDKDQRRHSAKSTIKDGDSAMQTSDERLPLDVDPGQHVPATAVSADNGQAQVGNCTKDHTARRTQVISWPDGDPENPYNWSTKKKLYLVIAGIVLVLNSTIGSSIASGTPVQVSEEFDNHNTYQLVLPVSMYLVGYVLGPIVFGPLSETYGRKYVLIGTFAMLTIFTMACALAPNFAAYVIFRLLVGVGASAPLSVVGGLYADVYRDPVTRGRAMAMFMAATFWGPIVGPPIAGFVSPSIGWRWVYWIALIFAGACWPILLAAPESYGPVLLARRAARMRKETGDESIHAPIDLESKSIRNLFSVVLARPINMFLFEPIVLFSCLYCAYAYGIFYLYLEAYPIIFQGIYGFNYGEVGLAFLPMGVGAVAACGMYLYWDVLLQRAKKRHSPWSAIEEYRRLPLACVGGPLFVISLFWIGWTARPGVHWIVPVLSGVPYGLAYLLIFMALLNYLVDAYSVYAASATAASATTRSLFGVLLPFATKPLYQNLGVPWACSLLGFLSLGLCVIPFIFLKYGVWLREHSKFCQELERQKQADEAEREARRTEGLKGQGQDTAKTDDVRDLEKGAEHAEPSSGDEHDTGGTRV